MKKIFGLLILVAYVLCMTSCSEEGDVIWDVAPAGIEIQLVDEDGNDLLNPEVEGNWVGAAMQISYDGETYDAIWSREDIKPRSRYYMPTFIGLVWNGALYDDNKDYNLYFGEFEGTENHDMHLTFSIDGMTTVYEFEYKHDFSWKKNEPNSDNHIIYNGKKIEGSTIVLTVPRNTK